MGAQKVLLPYGGRTVVEHIVHALEKGGADEVIVVTGHQGDRVASTLQSMRVRIAFNEVYPAGMLSSVRCGVRAASARTQAFLIALGDQPSIRTDVVKKLIAEFKNHKGHSGIILVPTHDGRRGHPMMFTRHFRDQVLSRFDDVGLRGLLDAYSEAIRELPMEQAEILRDMDSPEEYASELDALERRRRK